MAIHIGTSGWSYQEWKGSFYPPDLASDAMLSYYADRFNSVEVNNTFYRLPKREVLAGWAGKVPLGFSFVIKASQRITHKARLGAGRRGPVGLSSRRVRRAGRPARPRSLPDAAVAQERCPPC